MGGATLNRVLLVHDDALLARAAAELLPGDDGAAPGGAQNEELGQQLVDSPLALPEPS